MHSTHALRGTIFHHNGDFSGDVIIKRGKKEITVPFDDLKELVARYVVDHKVYQLENETNHDKILGVSREEE